MLSRPIVEWPLHQASCMVMRSAKPALSGWVGAEFALLGQDACTTELIYYAAVLVTGGCLPMLIIMVASCRPMTAFSELPAKPAEAMRAPFARNETCRAQ